MGHGVYPEKAHVGRVSMLTKRQVSFDAITLSLSSKQYATRSLFIFFPPDFLLLRWQYEVVVILKCDFKKEHMYPLHGTTMSDEMNMMDILFLILNLLAEFTKNIFLFMVTTQRISSRENRSNTRLHSWKQ